MRADDLPAIMAIERASFPNPWSSALFIQELALPFSRVMVARVEGAVAAYLCRWSVAGEMQILNVAVDPKCRRRGLARRLVREVLREADELQTSVVSLEVRRGNAAAQCLYASLGFTEAGCRPGYYGGIEDAVLMHYRPEHA